MSLSRWRPGDTRRPGASVRQFVRIEVEGGSEETREIFYTALFHALQVTVSSHSRLVQQLTALNSIPMSKARPEGTTLAMMMPCIRASRILGTLYG